MLINLFIRQDQNIILTKTVVSKSCASSKLNNIMHMTSKSKISIVIYDRELNLTLDPTPCGELNLTRAPHCCRGLYPRFILMVILDVVVHYVANPLGLKYLNGMALKIKIVRQTCYYLT